MDKEEVLGQIPIKADGRGGKGIYTSKSVDANANNGLRGKLTEAQLDERAVLHAKRQQTGNPTIASIIKHWKTKYEVTMSANSEYEWARNNQKRIDLAISQLEESGDMPIITVPNSTITASLASGARNALDLQRTTKRAMQKISDELELMTDWYHMIGATSRENYYKASDEQRKIYDSRLSHILKLKKSHVETFEIMSKSSSEQGKMLVDMMRTVSDLNKSGQAFDSMLEKRINDSIKEKGLKLQGEKDLEEFDPLEPVSDDQRIK